MRVCGGYQRLRVLVAVRAPTNQTAPTFLAAALLQASGTKHPHSHTLTHTHPQGSMAATVIVVRAVVWLAQAQNGVC